MMKLLAFLAAFALCTGVASARDLDGDGTYDLLFREGTLDGIERDQTLVYARTVSNSLKPEAEERDTGQIVLSFAEDAVPMAALELQQGERHRGLGRFPASVGNPMIMFFYETTIRDMAEAAGGSPFYIRNRIKEALIQPSQVEDGTATVNGQDIATQTVRLHPFADDPNKAQMQGFGDLELRVTMSDAVPGWYMSLVAEAGDVYRSEVQFDVIGPAE